MIKVPNLKHTKMKIQLLIAPIFHRSSCIHLSIAPTIIAKEILVILYTQILLNNGWITASKIYSLKSIFHNIFLLEKKHKLSNTEMWNFLFHTFLFPCDNFLKLRSNTRKKNHEKEKKNMLNT